MLSTRECLEASVLKCIGSGWENIIIWKSMSVDMIGKTRDKLYRKGKTIFQENYWGEIGELMGSTMQEGDILGMSLFYWLMLWA
jgi:hypothetical protein